VIPGLLFRPARTILVLVLLALTTLRAVAAPMIPAPPELDGTSWLLMDAASGKILVEHNVDARLPPASLTKMMTTYIAAEKLVTGDLKLDDQVLISEKAWRMQGSKMYVKVHSQVSVDDLMKGIIIQSGNDASIAIAEHIAGSEEAFADLMNQFAGKMGLTGTHFTNSTGWPDPEHYTTARDLAVLGRHVVYDHPDEYKYYSQKEFTYNGIKQGNRNLLLWRDSTVDGIKTGHTEEAGFCLVTSAVKDNMRLISVVMGTKGMEARATETQKLLNYGFRFYETVRSYGANEVLAEPELYFSAKDTVKLGLASDLLLTIPRGTQDTVTAELDYKPLELKAPISNGQALGLVRVKQGGNVIAEVPLVALESVEEANLMKRLWHHVLLFVKGLFA
jgi:D-alanyl-D-alanine carboxypeptidase (penicillin-binding protein 5/6)